MVSDQIPQPMPKEYRWNQILSEVERANISFYSMEIGFFKRLIEREKENDFLRQYCQFFVNYYEIELEQANERLGRIREELTREELRFSGGLV